MFFLLKGNLHLRQAFYKDYITLQTKVIITIPWSLTINVLHTLQKPHTVVRKPDPTITELAPLSSVCSQSVEHRASFPNLLKFYYRSVN